MKEKHNFKIENESNTDLTIEEHIKNKTDDNLVDKNNNDDNFNNSELSGKEE
jgi:hypothetical protein